jgi:hypothetical protein
MEREPAKNCLSERAAWRIFGRPFTMSEWNIPAPHDYAASVVPFAALFCALQDWDGMFFFDYNSDNKHWTADGITGFFSFVGQTHKLAGLAAFANMYRRGDLAPLAWKVSGSYETRPPSEMALECQIGISAKSNMGPDPQMIYRKDIPLSSPDGNVVWDATDNARPWVQVNAPASRAAWGMIANRKLELGSLKLEIGAAERDYAVLCLTSLDGLPLEKSKHMLLAAYGTAENTGMVWNDKRTSVGRKWGKGPALMNGIAANISLGSRITSVKALDPTGKPQGDVKVDRAGDSSSWRIGPEHRTIWYELRAQ